MHLNKPILSICIPTFNRAVNIKKNIESIICQNEFKNGSVEIVVSDNASNDNTKQLMEFYTKKYNNIFYYRNSSNIGNCNFPYVISKAHGKLRRLCNDNLYFKPHSLRYMCEIINKYSETQPYIAWMGQVSEKGIIETDFKGVIRNQSYWLTYIACFSIWGDECNNIDQDTYGADLLLWQVAKSLEILHKKNNAVLVDKHLVDVQYVENKNVCYGIYKVFYENFMMLLNPYVKYGILSSEDIDFLEKELLFKHFLQYGVRYAVQDKTMIYSDTEDLNKLLFIRYRQKKYWKEYERKFNRLVFCSKLKTKIKTQINRLLGRE